MSTNFEAEILEIIDETDGIKTFNLTKPENFEFKSGQYAWLSLPELSKAPMAIASGAKDDYLTFTIRKWGEMTTKLFEMKPGDKVLIDGPHGTFFPPSISENNPLLLIAGGTGITPIRSYLRSQNSRKNITVLYGAQTPDQILYRDEHHSWIGRIAITVDAGDEMWQESVGLVTDLIAQREIEPETICFVCGPKGMEKAAIDVLRSKNIPDNQIYVSVERFDSNGNVVGPVLALNDPIVGM